MSAANGSAKERGPRPGRVVLAVAAVLCAGVVVAGALRFQAFSGAAYAMFAVFAFPAPVAIGVSAGLLWPRGGLAWPPAWACIAGAVSAVLLSGAIEDATAMGSPARMAGVAAAAAVAALSVCAARQAVARGMAVRLAAAVLLGALATALAGYGIAALNARAFRAVVAPAMLLELDSNYLSLPKGAGWSTRPVLDAGCFEIQTSFHGRPLLIRADHDVPTALCVAYDLPGSTAELRDDRSARAYLAHLGFRGRLLDSLVRDDGPAIRWRAGLGRTQLTLTGDGAVSLSPLSERGLRTGCRSMSGKHDP